MGVPIICKLYYNKRPTAPQASGGRKIWRICPGMRSGPCCSPPASSCSQAAGSWRDTAARSRTPSPPPGQPAGGRNHRSEHRRPGGSGASAGHWPGQGGGHRRLPDGARPLSDGGPVDGGLRDRGGHPGGPASVYHSLRPGLTRPPTVFRTKGVSSYGKNIGRGRRARPGKGDHL